jgi:hypothetical protein
MVHFVQRQIPRPAKTPTLRHSGLDPESRNVIFRRETPQAVSPLHVEGAASKNQIAKRDSPVRANADRPYTVTRIAGRRELASNILIDELDSGSSPE